MVSVFVHRGLSGGVAAPGWVPDLLCGYSLLPGHTKVSQAGLLFGLGAGGVNPARATPGVRTPRDGSFYALWVATGRATG